MDALLHTPDGVRDIYGRECAARNVIEENILKQFRLYGYDRIETHVGNEKTVEFRINPEQSKTVRMIYDMYLRGDGLTKIKYRLEQEGRLTATGKTKWFETVISNVLKNSFYCGIITYHKEFTPDYLKQKKIKNYGEVELTQVKGRHEPIVTVEEYDNAPDLSGAGVPSDYSDIQVEKPAELH